MNKREMVINEIFHRILLLIPAMLIQNALYYLLKQSISDAIHPKYSSKINSYP